MTKNLIPTINISSIINQDFNSNKSTEAINKIKKEQKKSENLLLNILPSSTASRLKSGETLIADDIKLLSFGFPRKLIFVIKGNS